MRPKILARILAALAAILLLPRASLQAADKIVLGTDWRAEAEHGGFYQAIAAGIYARHGIEVTIRPGGPQVNQAQLLAAGRLDFMIAPNSFIPLNLAQEGVPAIAVAAFFQKDPQALLAHPGQGNDDLASLKGKPIMIGADTRIGSWRFLKAKFGYRDDQIRPYANSLAPFLADPKAIQQGYVISEPYLIERQGVKPVVMLLADNGYPGYAGIIMTRRPILTATPDLVRRFIEASAEGWQAYLHGDPAPADALIRTENPEMTDELLAYGREKLKAYGIVEGGDAPALGLGAMTAARWRDFFTAMAAAGAYPPDLDYSKAFTLQFQGARER